MTDKQERILKAALDLFAKNGYAATSTSAVAKQAGVSEGLIFRHFANKKGLLQALVKETEVRINQLLAPILAEENPTVLLQKVLSLPFSIDGSEYDFWRLNFKLKWDPEYNDPDKLLFLRHRLEQVFADLGYNDPANEALLIQQLLDTISIALLRDEYDDAHGFRDFLLEKYAVPV